MSNFIKAQKKWNLRNNNTKRTQVKAPFESSIQFLDDTWDEIEDDGYGPLDIRPYKRAKLDEDDDDI